MITNKDHNHNNNEICKDPNCFLSDPKKASIFWEAIEKCKSEGYIKVEILDTNGESETVWADPLDSHTAIIKNVPFFVSHIIGLNDIIETKGDGFLREYVRVIQENTFTGFITYLNDNDDEKVEERYKSIRLALQNNKGISVEGMVFGHACVSFDLDKYDENDAIDIVEKLSELNPDWKLKILFGDNEND